jgi:hypothetical protein
VSTMYLMYTTSMANTTNHTPTHMYASTRNPLSVSTYPAAPSVMNASDSSDLQRRRTPRSHPRQSFALGRWEQKLDVNVKCISMNERWNAIARHTRALHRLCSRGRSSASSNNLGQTCEALVCGWMFAHRRLGSSLPRHCQSKMAISSGVPARSAARRERGVKKMRVTPIQFMVGVARVMIISKSSG